MKNPTQDRKVTVMDFIKARMITFAMNEVNGEEMEDDLKQYIKTQTDKINTGYWDYSGKNNK
ncbi:hypothetical protein [Fictibacillus phosphorivorans]|uniref:hypothetical protein n=1 Tax=Fictibacillus phosphorivorans TaxID=1221500 RepID=UPI0035EE5252